MALTATLAVVASVPQTAAATARAGAAASPARAGRDRPDTAKGALAAAPEKQKSWLRETLPAGDVDWFHFHLTSSTAAVAVTLGGLPADYDLAVFDAAGHQLAASTRAGRTFDEVWLHPVTGELLARVTRKRGAAAGAYALRLRAFARGVQMLSAARTATRGGVIGEFYNATGQWLAVSELDADWLDRRGRSVHHLVTAMDPAAWIRPWSRVPFTVGDQITDAVDARTVAFRVTPRLVPQDVPPGEAALSARITRTVTWQPSATTVGGRAYDGWVSTTSRRRVRTVKVYVCEYDGYGALQVLGKSDSVYDLPARGRRPWHGDAYGKNWAKPALVTVRGYENLGG